jgi:hypothetical protein
VRVAVVRDEAHVVIERTDRIAARRDRHAFVRDDLEDRAVEKMWSTTRSSASSNGPSGAVSNAYSLPWTPFDQRVSTTSRAVAHTTRISVC